MKKITILLAALATIFTTNIFAQSDNNTDEHGVAINIPEVALVDVEGSNRTITLAPETPTEAGEFLDFSNATDNSLWLNYSSVVGAKTEASRKVSVAITNGSVPGGMELYVAAGSISSGKGQTGTATGRVKLSSTPSELVSGIGTCYTENGTEKGHQLTYSLGLADEKDASSQYRLRRRHFTHHYLYLDRQLIFHTGEHKNVGRLRLAGPAFLFFTRPYCRSSCRRTQDSTMDSRSSLCSFNFGELSEFDGSGFFTVSL